MQRDDVLHVVRDEPESLLTFRQLLFGPLDAGDVAARSAITQEFSMIVKSWPAADAGKSGQSFGIPHSQHNAGKRFAMVEQFPMLRPTLIGHSFRKELPTRFAEGVPGLRTVLWPFLGRYKGETMCCIGFPVPVRRYLGQCSEALLGFPQLLFRLPARSNVPRTRLEMQ